MYCKGRLGEGLLALGPREIFMGKLFLTGLFLMIAQVVQAEGLHDYNFKDVEGKDVPMSQFKDRPVLLVNIATQCGFTKQLDGLEKLHQEYKAKGLVVIGVPSNEFLSQTPEEDKEVVKFCRLKYGVTFAVYAKLQVKGSEAHPLFKYLLQKRMKNVRWNFEKFVFDKQGMLQNSFGSSTGPEDEELRKAIDKVL